MKATKRILYYLVILNTEKPQSGALLLRYVQNCLVYQLIEYGLLKQIEVRKQIIYDVLRSANIIHYKNQ